MVGLEKPKTFFFSVKCASVLSYACVNCNSVEENLDGVSLLNNEIYLYCNHAYLGTLQKL